MVPASNYVPKGLLDLGSGPDFTLLDGLENPLNETVTLDRKRCTVANDCVPFVLVASLIYVGLLFALVIKYSVVPWWCRRLFMTAPRRPRVSVQFHLSSQPQDQETTLEDVEEARSQQQQQQPRHLTDPGYAYTQGLPEFRVAVEMPVPEVVRVSSEAVGMPVPEVAEQKAENEEGRVEVEEYGDSLMLPVNDSVVPFNFVDVPELTGDERIVEFKRHHFDPLWGWGDASVMLPDRRWRGN